ncbi:MAG: MFS transporter [Lachnospiraceae bacterium]
MNRNYQATMTACFIGYIVQAIVNNFAPLLFLTFQTSYQIPLTQITLLVTVNFGIQLLIDLLSAFFVDKIGYRACMIVAHVCSATGLVALTLLPEVLPSAFLGILLSVCIYAVGGGLIEVLVSPIMESCPTDNKETAMSLLHSFYCWGQVGVVLISTLFFHFFGIAQWKLLAVLWAVIPVCNAIVFTKVPLAALIGDDEPQMSVRTLMTKNIFWTLMLIMLCAGASEQTISQWASTFVESGLGISKTVGDLLGPMTFALLMGCSRAYYGKYGSRINLNHFMRVSGMLCLMAYLCIALIPSPVFGLAGLALCGLSVGILWPGTFSRATVLKNSGTALFALLALAGDFGCFAGPTLAGFISGHFHDNLKVGILVSALFPLALLLGLSILSRQTKSD